MRPPSIPGIALAAALAAARATACHGEDGATSALLAAPPAGGIALAVDGRDLPRGLLRAHQVVEARAGELVLVFPKWIPGAHAPAGRVDNLVGLRATVGARELGWDRDEADPYRIVVHVPAGVDRIGVDSVYLANQSDTNSAGVDVVGTEGLAVVSWNCAVLYPEGRAAAAIPVDLAFTAPGGWRIGTAMAVAGAQGDTWRFARQSLRDLVDQPLIAGPAVETVPLAGDGPPVSVAVGATGGAAVALDPRWREHLAATADQARRLFGRAHYRAYRWLFVAGDEVEGLGLEHANCSLCGFPGDALHDYASASYDDRDLPVHEFIHSWCGKHVRPAGMATADFQAQQRFDLLWVYEGLTQYLGEVVGARAGLATPEEFRDHFAATLHDLAHQSGRAWRSVADTARATWMLREWSRHYHELRRDQDYYLEGMRFWLEADLIIRAESRGQRSLDDFCRVFLGAPVEPGAVRGYGLDDVVAGLEAVQHHDWRGLIAARIYALCPTLDTAFLETGGWRLAYRAEPAGTLPAEDESTLLDQRQGLGCRFLEHGAVGEVVTGSPADRAGLYDGLQVRKLDGAQFGGRQLEAALSAAAAGGPGTLTFTVWDGHRERQVVATCATGPLHPRLERVPAQPDLLGAILAPR
jgi:predicted metalloprotease with PDZ domain